MEELFNRSYYFSGNSYDFIESKGLLSEFLEEYPEPEGPLLTDQDEINVDDFIEDFIVQRDLKKIIEQFDQHTSANEFLIKDITNKNSLYEYEACFLLSKEDILYRICESRDIYETDEGSFIINGEKEVRQLTDKALDLIEKYGHIYTDDIRGIDYIGFNFDSVIPYKENMYITPASFYDLYGDDHYPIDLNEIDPSKKKDADLLIYDMWNDPEMCPPLNYTARINGKHSLTKEQEKPSLNDVAQESRGASDKLNPENYLSQNQER